MFYKECDDSYFQEMNKFIGNLLPVIETHVNKMIKDIFANNNFSEKQLKKLYDCLLSSFQFAILNADEKYKKQNKEINDFADYFLFLLNEFKREDFMDSHIHFVMQGSYRQNNYIMPNMYKLIFKPKYPTDADANCFFNDLVNIWISKSDEVEKEWLKYMLKNLLYDEANLKTNNFIDFLIIKDFTLDSRINYLITCDVGMQKIMRVLSSNNKICESLDLLTK